MVYYKAQQSVLYLIRPWKLIIFCFLAQSSKYIFILHKCEDIYSILQNEYLCIYKDSFGSKRVKDDCALGKQKFTFGWFMHKYLFKPAHSWFPLSKKKFSGYLTL